MKELIGLLKTLNELDARLLTLKKDIERLPKELDERATVVKNLKIVIEKLDGDIKKLKVEADAIELEVKTGDDALKRYNAQLNIAKTKKEYETIRGHMDAQRVWIRDYENKALELLEKIDAKSKDLAKNNASLGEAENALKSETERISAEVATLKAEYDGLMAQRNERAQGVPEKELSLYNRIVAVRGNAIAKVDRGICSACFMKLPPQVHNLALLGNEVVTCSSCGRILTAN